ncbi:hypothetical protein Q0F99_10825 [Rathayibacter oskolensis]|uniref:hypothetical protein n=1 Tax=Rathayibacter oskolensis TaxID=1891671 RepID=UPI00265E065C|nr:hypothetical protein [Rathayibacter oskolensis]WKK70381.1 hypothetical protein Q0F99_10825 [Rathayibacter oskolensis]
MLTELDDRVLAAINLHAVLGALPRLVELSPEAARALAPVRTPTTLTLIAPGGLRASYTFTSTSIRRGEERPARRCCSPPRGTSTPSSPAPRSRSRWRVRAASASSPASSRRSARCSARRWGPRTPWSPSAPPCSRSRWSPPP